ncbi:MAG: RICIN domain-containing protein [Eubacterium sp.]
MKLKHNEAYRILAQEKELALGVENNSMENNVSIKLQNLSDTNKENQIWSVFYVDDNWFKLINRHSGKAMDLKLCGIENGTWIHQWDVLDSVDSQLWSAEMMEDGLYRLKSKQAMTFLDIAGGTVVTNAQIQIWEETGNTNQLWRFEPIEQETAIAEKVTVKKETSKITKPKTKKVTVPKTKKTTTSPKKETRQINKKSNLK